MRTPARFASILLLGIALPLTAFAATSRSPGDPVSIQPRWADEHFVMRGAVVIQTVNDHEIMIAARAARRSVDAVNPVEEDVDGTVDHIFLFWSDAPLQKLDLSARSASIQYLGNELSIIAADRQLSLLFTVGSSNSPRAPEPFSSMQFHGYGLNHQLGPNVQKRHLSTRLGGVVALEDCFHCEEFYDSPEFGGASAGGSCDSGGAGSTSCSITDNTGSCAVACTPGYYACCQRDSMFAHNLNCKCIKY